MGLFKKKKTNSIFEEHSETVVDDLEYNGAYVAVTFKKDESFKHVSDDFKALELIRNIKKDKYWNRGELQLPLTGTTILANIDFDVDPDYAQACAEHAVHLQEHREITDVLYEKAVSYCEMYRDCFDDEGIDIPEGIQGSEIMKYIDLEGITISAPEGEGVAYTLYGGCRWEEEHGIEISICNNRVGYVGEFCAVDPWKE